MIKKILYPTDFSEHSQRCIDYILKLKDCGIEELVLLHVADEKIISNTDMIFEEAIDEDEVIEKCKRSAIYKLEKIAKRFEEAGIKTKILFQVGVPFSKIIRTAEEENVSLIILGNHGHNLAEELLLGSTAEKVARKSKRTVMLVR